MIHFDSFSISKREIIVSIAIIAIMLVFGFMIHGAINDSLMLHYQEYNKALQINEDTEMFKYAMSTNVGNSFVYGELKCIDTVSYPEIDGQYSYIKKVKEEYTAHTRVVSTGKTTTVQTYYTWDEKSSESKHCNKITFLGVEFDYGQINFPYESQIATIKDPFNSDIRYVYYGSPTECKGTLYSDLRNNTINDSEFYRGRDIASVLSSLKSGAELVLFWFGWVLLTGGLVFAFIYIDNNWLEDKLESKNNKYRYKYFNYYK